MIVASMKTMMAAHSPEVSVNVHTTIAMTITTDNTYHIVRFLDVTADMNANER